MQETRTGHGDVVKTKPAYDLIGDIHGHHDKLTALLHRLGYVPCGTTHRHPEGRRVVFLGDYIDRGPKIRETLHLVRGMVDAGDALAIMGNHELNAIHYATPDGKGGHLRKRTAANVKQHAATLAAFTGREDEWTGWLEWMRRLPFYLDLGGLRAVHACWDTASLPLLRSGALEDEAFLHAGATKGTPEYQALEHVLKGPELPLPEGATFTDKEGTPRRKVRARWWGLIGRMTVGEAVMPEPMPDVHHPLEPAILTALPNYGAHEPPVFFGHYWMPADRAKEPLAANLACLDYSGAFGDHPLVAYRWDGETQLTSGNYVTSAAATATA